MDPRNVKQAASSALAAASGNPKKLLLLHTGIVVLFSLITSLLQFLLEMGMDATGGLSGIPLRSLLTSAQLVLSLAGLCALPFWQIGLLQAGLHYSRRETVTPGTLLEGFRRFFPVLRLKVLLALIALGVSFASAYISTTIFMFSPFSDPLYEAMNTLLETTDATAITAEMLEPVFPHAGWLMVLHFAVMLVIGLPVLYRYRMSEFALMDGANGALAAMRESILLSRGRRMEMFKFDLSFWWYYGAQLLIAAIAYMDMILAALGIVLPFSATVMYWILFAVYGVASLVFYRQYGAYYYTAYAEYYRQLRENPLFPPPRQQNN